MRQINSAIRNAYLSSAVTPLSRLTVRQNRLDFGGSPLVKNTTVIQSGVLNDDQRLGYYVWGDSCVSANGTYIVRLVNRRAFGTGTGYFVSITSTPTNSASWAYTSLSGGTTPQPYCRIGLGARSESTSHAVFEVWVATAANLYVQRLIYTKSSGTWGWSTLSNPLPLEGRLSCAIHPLGPGKALVVSFNQLVVIEYVEYDWDIGGWTGHAARTVWVADTTDLNDIHFSDAVLQDGYVLAVLNLSRQGTPYAIRYSLNGKHPGNVLPILGVGAGDWSHRFHIAGLTQINDRCWAVINRGLGGSDELVYASHVGLVSTADGIHWRDEPDFVGLAPCFGRLHVLGNTAVVCGNAVVYTAPAPYKLGVDNAALKMELTSADGWQLDCPGEGGISHLTVRGIAETSSLLQPGNEVYLDIGAQFDGGPQYSPLFKGTIYSVGKEKGYPDLETYRDSYQLDALGPGSNLGGETAYQPMIARVYEGVETFYSRFISEKNNPLMSMAGMTGVWQAEGYGRGQFYALRGEQGIALAPMTFTAPHLTAVTTFRISNDLEGIFFVFWYRNAENYWRAGLRRLSKTDVYVVIEKVEGGVTQPLFWSEYQKFTMSDAANSLWSLMVRVFRGQVVAYLLTGRELNFASAMGRTAGYSLTSSDVTVPGVYHCGLEVTKYTDFSLAYATGTISKSFERQIQDYSQNFTKDYVGKYLYLPTSDEWRLIVNYEAVKISNNNVALSVDSAFSRIPLKGETYAVYGHKGHPSVFFEMVSICGQHYPWTTGELATSILEQAGVSRSPEETITIISSTPVFLGDLDIKIPDPTTTQQIYFGANSTDDITCHRYRLTLEPGRFILRWGKSGSEIMLLSAYYPLGPFHQWSSITSADELRIVYRKGWLTLWNKTMPLGAVGGLRDTGFGYCWISGNTGYQQELPRLVDSFIFDQETASQALSRLLGGYLVKMVDRGDGTVTISYYANPADLGSWSTTVVHQAVNQQIVPSMLAVDGAEHRVYYLDPYLSRWMLRLRSASVYEDETDDVLIRDAARLARFARERFQQRVIRLHVPDPAAEPEDKVTYDSATWLVNSVRMAMSFDVENPSFSMEAELRARVLPQEPGVYNSPNSRYGECVYA